MATPRYSPRSKVIAGVLLGGSWLAIAVATWPTPIRPGTDPPPPTLARSSLSPLGFAPISFFNANCAACHGDYGAFLAWDLEAAEQAGRSLHDRSGLDALLRSTREMVEGQARTSLPDDHLAALAAYQRSLIDRRPFLALTTIGGELIAGEVTPGSVVFVELSTGEMIQAEVQGHQWALAGADAPAAIRATLNGHASIIARPAPAHSHAEDPDEAPTQ